MSRDWKIGFAIVLFVVAMTITGGLLSWVAALILGS